MKISYVRYLEVADDITQIAGDFLAKKFGVFKEMKMKEADHYGIEEDAESNSLYEKYLKKHTPEVSLYTEEGEKNLSSDLTWVVDPIEGTSNYRVGNPFFATQISLLEAGVPAISIVYAPLLSQKFTAVKNKGAFLNGRKIFASKLKDLNLSVVSFGRGRGEYYTNWFSETMTKMLPEIRTPRTFGACGLEMAYTSAGMIDVFLNNGSKLYDYAPGVLLMREAGGLVINERGKNWSHQDNFLIASNKNLIKKVQNLLLNKS